MPHTPNPRTRWLMLALMVASNAFIATMPTSAMPVLFKEIADDLHLSLVQVGSVWGIASLAGIFMSLLAGVLADRFGTRRTIILFGALTAATGALRGISDSFGALLFWVFLSGAVRLVIPVAVTKNVGLWFRDSPRFGLAMGLAMMGMGTGLSLGPLVSASVLSPWLGGWRHVLFFIGGLSGLVTLIWIFFAKDAPEQLKVPETPAAPATPHVSVFKSMGELLHVRAVWVLGGTLAFRVFCLMGVTGYVPLYLRTFLNWGPGSADGTLAVFYATSAAIVVPMTFLSDRLRSRRKIMVPALALSFISPLLLPSANGAWVWVLMIVNGMWLDTFMSLTTTLLMEAKGVRPEYFGTAIGIIFTMGQVGAVSGPPLGALFTRISGGAPFYAWAAAAFIAFLIFTFIKITRPASKVLPAS